MIYVLSKNNKNITIFHMKIIVLIAVKNCSILHRHVCIMSSNDFQENDPLLSGSPFKGNLMSLEGSTYGGFPIKFLVLVVSLSVCPFDHLQPFCRWVCPSAYHKDWNMCTSCGIWHRWIHFFFGWNHLVRRNLPGHPSVEIKQIEQTN